MAILSKFIIESANKKHSRAGSFQDEDEGETLIIPAIPALADNVC